MKHRIGFNRLGRKASHRKALHRNMTTSLFKYERIKTTKAKALAIRRTAEKMITRSKVDSVHNRRVIAKDINDKEILAKLFTDIGPRFKERAGGYTRILKLGYRQGDAAEMVLLELVTQEKTEKKKKKKKAEKPVKEAKVPGEDKKEAVAAEETVEEKAAEKAETVEEKAVETEEVTETGIKVEKAETEQAADEKKESKEE